MARFFDSLLDLYSAELDVWMGNLSTQGKPPVSMGVVGRCLWKLFMENCPLGISSSPSTISYCDEALAAIIHQ